MAQIKCVLACCCVIFGVWQTGESVWPGKLGLVGGWPGLGLGLAGMPQVISGACWWPLEGPKF